MTEQAGSSYVLRALGPAVRRMRRFRSRRRPRSAPELCRYREPDAWPGRVGGRARRRRGDGGGHAGAGPAGGGGAAAGAAPAWLPDGMDRQLRAAARPGCLHPASQGGCPDLRPGHDAAGPVHDRHRRADRRIGAAADIFFWRCRSWASIRRCWPFAAYYCATGEPPMRILSGSSFTHVSGQMPAFLTLFEGGTLFLGHNSSPAEFLTTVERERISSTFLTPALLYEVIDHPQRPRTPAACAISTSAGRRLRRPGLLRRSTASARWCAWCTGPAKCR